MRCAWKEFLSILPLWIRQEVDRQGRDELQELRLRAKAPPELRLRTGSCWLKQECTREDICFVINTASRYSPWAAETLAQGYITAPGGHRVGISGTAVCRNGTVTGIRDASSLCIRVARDFPGIAEAAAYLTGSILVIGAPGWGKTTLLRDLCRQISEKDTVSVVDERGEVFPEGLDRGKRMDVLSGCPKQAGIHMALRTMGPICIAVDEITEPEDCVGLLHAANCGVRLAATAHASSLEEFYARPVYEPLIRNKVFQNVLVLHPDKSYRAERMAI